MIPGVNRQRGPRGGSRQLRPAEAGLVAAACGACGACTPNPPDGGPAPPAARVALQMAPCLPTPGFLNAVCLLTPRRGGASPRNEFPPRLQVSELGKPLLAPHGRAGQGQEAAVRGAAGQSPMVRCASTAISV